MNRKECKKCGVLFTKDNIYRYRGNTRTSCKDCINENSKKLYRKRAKLKKGTSRFDVS